jgi:hypothetical protein
MTDYSDVCTAIKHTIRTAYELANERKLKEALEEARFLSALATQLEEALKKELGK